MKPSVIFVRALSPLLATATLAAAGLACTGDAQAVTPPFSALYVFGDSLSDSGNNYLSFGSLTGPNPPNATFVPTLPYAPSHTYSNGPTWVSGFAAGIGLASYAAPSLTPGGGGGNYAYGGAKTVGSGGFPPSLQTQLSGYLTSGPAVTASALYVIAGGGNDARAVGDAVAGGADLASTTLAGAAAYATATAQMVASLKLAGAQNIVVWTVPDLGKTPAAGAGVGSAADAGSFIAGTFNTVLSGALAGSGVTVFDTYALIDKIVLNPALYGFGNVTKACGFAGNGCNAANALFWDGIHPTAFAQGYIANQMLAAVPEPGSVWLFIAGLAGLGTLRRQRRV